MNRPTRLKAYLLAGVVLGGLPTIALAQSADTQAGEGAEANRAAAEGAALTSEANQVANESSAVEEAARSAATLAPEDVVQLKRELRDDLKEEIRQELKEELREELIGEIEEARGRPLETPSAAVQADAWAEEGWKWDEPTRPDYNVVEIDGYFRFRYDFFSRLDLGTYYNLGNYRVSDGTAASGPFARLVDGSLPDTSGREATEEETFNFQQGPFVPGLTAPPTPLCNTDVGYRADSSQTGSDDVQFGNNANSCAGTRGRATTLAGANIRFRLEPTINVFEDVKIRSQIDVLDNLVFGSTPDSSFSPLSPLAAVTQTQIAPTNNLNTIWRDSIRVKRVWAEVMTPLGQLSFGRMPNHVGLGITANNGNGIDQDFGDTVDRVMFAAEVGGFTVAPAFDFAASGATSLNQYFPQGQPFDLDDQDDVNRYVLTVSKITPPEVREQKLANSEVIFDFGTQVNYTAQTIDSNSSDALTIQDQARDVDSDGNVADEPGLGVDRDANILNYTLWGEFKWRKLTVAAEYAGVFGQISSREPVGSGFGSDRDRSENINLFQMGGALKASYKFLDNEALTVELLVLAASGDRAPGWGLFPMYEGGAGRCRGFTPETLQSDPTYSGCPGTPGAWDGTQLSANDNDINNFVFDPDFIVDLIFWRQMVGAVTDALVVKPSIQYDITEEIGGRLDIIYSRAFFAQSTPSGSLDSNFDLDIGGNSGGSFGNPDPNLGIEFDVNLFYKSMEGFNARLQYGLFIPMDGLDRQTFIEPFIADGEDRGTVTNTEFSDQLYMTRTDAGVAHTIQVLLGVAF